MSTTTFVYVQFQREGYHCFPEAATDPKYATGDQYDVSHLAYRHMHYFYFKVWVEVVHGNREIEFIFEHEDDFLNVFTDGHGWTLTDVSFSSVSIKLVYILESGQHVADSKPILQYMTWKEKCI
jgi:hypothetical protein